MGKGIKISGFTIMEVVMVMSIVSITAMAITPRILESIEAWELDSETRKLALKIRELQQSAFGGSIGPGIRFNNVTSCYDIGTYVNGTGFTPYNNYCIDTNIQLDNMICSVIVTAPYILYFDQFGEPHAESSGTGVPAGCDIRLRDTQTPANRLTVEVTRVSGRVRLKT